MQVCNRGLCSFVGTGTSVVQKQKKGIVPLPPRCLAVGGSEQGFHFSLIKIADRQARSPFEWNRPDLAAPFEMLWTVQTDEVRQGADGSQPLIACPHITIAALFRVEQELTDSRRENFIHSKLVGGFVSFVGDGPNDKTKGISVAPLRVETQVTHADEEFQKEPSYPRTEESGISHGRPPQNVLFEALAGLRQEFWCHRQIDRGSCQICMAQINGRIRQQSLHFSALSIPCDETVNRESMAQILNPRLVASAIGAMDAGMFSEPTEVSLKGGHVNWPSVPL